MEGSGVSSSGRGGDRSGGGRGGVLRRLSTPGPGLGAEAAGIAVKGWEPGLFAAFPQFHLGDSVPDRIVGSTHGDAHGTPADCSSPGVGCSARDFQRDHVMKWMLVPSFLTVQLSRSIPGRASTASAFRPIS